MPTLTSDGATFAYTDTGAPPSNPHAATIVFGHGLLFSGRMFAAQIAELRAHYRCVTIDWRGQGDSPPSSAGYDMDSLTDDARALIGHLAAAPVHYVGLSMGGFVGMRLAARHPDLIRSLVLLDTSAAPEVPAAARKDRLLANVFRVVGIAPVQRPVRKVMFGPSLLADLADPARAAVMTEWVRGLARSDRAAIRGAVLAVANRVGITDEIAAITAPTLVVVGADDVPTPPHRSRAIAAAIAGARLEVVAECGHSSTVEQPGAVTALIRDFLSAH